MSFRNRGDELGLPKRKPQRLKGYDYSKNNAYFVTICTQNRAHLFGKIVDAAFTANTAGKMVEKCLLNISKPSVITIDKYVIMPNHVHIIILISNSGTTQGSFPTVSELLQRFKTITTKLYIDGVKESVFLPFDKKIWQKSFHDHIIRNEDEYQKTWQYIDENPLRWAEDEYF